MTDSKMTRAAETAEGLLGLVGRASSASEADLEAIRSALSSGDVAWEALRAWVSAWPSPPASEDDFRRWLIETEALVRANKGLARLGIETDAVVALRLVLSDVLEVFEQRVVERDDHCLFAGDAERIGFQIAPWSWLRSGTVGSFLARYPDATNQLCRLWLHGRVHPDDAAQLRARLADAPVRNALREAIARECAELAVTRWNPDWSIDVARTEAELPFARELLNLRIPHTGKQLLVRQHARGTWWEHPVGAPELVPFEATRHAWRDDELGEFTTTIRVVDPSPTQDVRHALVSLDRIADGLKTPRNLEIALAVASCLRDGVLGTALREGHRAFEQGTDVAEGTAFRNRFEAVVAEVFGQEADAAESIEQLVRHALEARLLMPDVSMALASDGIDIVGLNKVLFEADELHRDHGSALQLIPDELYDECVDHLPLDTNEWWGSRARIEATVPRGLVDVLLRDVADEAWQGRRDVLAIDDARAKRRRVPSAATFQISLAAASKRTHVGSSHPCEWFRVDAGPKPGCVPLLLLDETAGKGIVAELRVTLDNRSDDEAVWAGADVLQQLARDIVRDAYYATASMMPAGAAPPPFGMHRLDLVIDSLEVDATIVAVDGRSVGLPAALAFASAWAEQPIAADVAAIGTVRRHRAIDAVGGVAEKARALATFAGGRQLRIVAAPANEGDVRTAGLVPVPATKLDEALHAAGLTPRVSVTGTFGSVVLRERALRELVTDIEMGDRTKYGGGRARWEQLGDDLRALIRSVETAQTSLQAADFARARCIAALAYSHGGMLSDVKDVLREVQRPEALPLSIRALFDIVRLGEHIDHETLAEPTGKAAIATVTADLEELRRVADREMLGRAAGTLGRAYMHLRELERAIPLLQEGVRHHAEHQKHETARSRIYLSMALRMSGRPHEALEQLVTASSELETFTRPYSPEYEVATRPYLDYELARVLVSLERHEEAHRVASRALESCQWTLWPQLGVLRVRAWAARMSGRLAEADEDVERMRPWAQSAGPVGERLVEEAIGFPAEGGETY